MSGDGLILLLVQSALRSLLLGAVVFALLKLARLRDLRTETAIWTMVLLAAVFMPLLSVGLPGGVAVPLPHIPLPHPAIAAAAPIPAVPAASGPLTWALAHAGSLLWDVYCLVTLAGLARLITGLVLTLELYRAAQPITEDWARGRDIRVSRAVNGPLSLASCILLPADYRAWSDAKRMAVLAHEESHIRRGDFFIQLLAAAHRAIFWFSPFAWWLQLRLGELAETASDKAAIRRINDPTGYAEILVEVSLKARGLQATVAMARGPGVAKRVDQILAGIPERSLSAVGRIVTLALVLTLSLAFAQVHAAITPAAHNPLPLPILFAVSDPAPVTTRPAAAARAAHAVPVRAKALARPALAPAAPEPDFTYNPRALLDDPDAAVLPTFVRLGAAADKSANDVGTVLDTLAGPHD